MVNGFISDDHTVDFHHAQILMSSCLTNSQSYRFIEVQSLAAVGGKQKDLVLTVWRVCLHDSDADVRFEATNGLNFYRKAWRDLEDVDHASPPRDNLVWTN